MKYFIHLLSALMAFILPLSSFAMPPNLHLKNPGVLSVCSYSEFTPVSYGEGKGYEADLLRALAKKWHLKIRFYPEKVYEGIWTLPSRPGTQCDLAIGGISPMKYRAEQGAAFTVLTTHFAQSLLLRTADYQSGALRSYRDFKNSSYKIGVVPGTTGARYARQQAKEAHLNPAVLVDYPSESALLLALKQRKIDAIARGEIGNQYQASIDPTVTVAAIKDFGEGFAFVVARGNTALLDALNAEITVLTQQGKINYFTWLHNPRVFDQQ